MIVRACASRGRVNFLWQKKFKWFILCRADCCVQVPHRSTCYPWKLQLQPRSFQGAMPCIIVMQTAQFSQLFTRYFPSAADTLYKLITRHQIPLSHPDKTTAPTPRTACPRSSCSSRVTLARHPIRKQPLRQPCKLQRRRHGHHLSLAGRYPRSRSGRFALSFGS